MSADKSPVWTPAELHRQLATGSHFTILDLRDKDEFEAWRIEGRIPLKSVNIPYFDLLDIEDENEEIAQSVVRAAPARLKHDLPKRGTTLVVCARGDTSTHVAEGLRRLGYQAVNLEGGMAAWGDHYEVRAVEETPRLTLLQVSRPARGCLGYILAGGGEAMVVDPSRHIETYVRIAEERGWRIARVMDSHLQADHISGGVALAQALGVEYWLHPYDALHPEDLLPAPFPFHFLAGDMTFTLGGVGLRALHLPGHTLGMTNLLVNGHYLLTGDTLFIDSIGRPDLGGRAKAWTPLLYRSLQRILALPESTVVLPAHFSHANEADEQGRYLATLGELRDHNEGLRMHGRGKAAFAAHILASLPKHPPAYDEIRRVNVGLLEVDEARAGELELGRNRCALAHHEAVGRMAA